MSFPAYEFYKDIGIEWLGSIPVGWSVKSIKRIASIQYGIGEPPKYQEEGTRLVRATNIRRGVISDEGMVSVDPTHIPEQRIVWLNEGDIIVVRSGAYTGDSAIIPDGYGEAIAGFDMVLRIHDAVPQFVQYALLSNYVKEGQLELMRMRAAQPHLNAEELGGCQFVAPPLDEQKAISSFLDVETSKIDGLVSEQRRLIELLKEKRQAVISHAVTKGLNPNAPMKPSGIQWLGDVPQHWAVVSVRRVIAEIEQGWSPQCDSRPADEHEWGILKTGCVNRGVFSEIENKALPEDLEPIVEYEVKRGDVLMSRASGSSDLVGATAFVYDVRPHLMLSDKTFRIHLADTMEPEFVVAVFNSELMRAQIEQSISGAEGLANNLPQSKLKCFALALPPITEQVEIVRELASRCQRFDTLQAEAERAIELLQERRTALISAAVTGKIDVREFASEAVA